ncbi:hypothetical protein SVAN01_02086 [Stagonosporopsis vannaccii]|nr:hypothetical protein SVAN01_02086 [Stagonosporopsis vannaccii]
MSFSHSSPSAAPSPALSHHPRGWHEHEPKHERDLSSQHLPSPSRRSCTPPVSPGGTPRCNGSRDRAVLRCAGNPETARRGASEVSAHAEGHATLCLPAEV